MKQALFVSITSRSCVLFWNVRPVNYSIFITNRITDIKLLLSNIHIVILLFIISLFITLSIVLQNFIIEIANNFIRLFDLIMLFNQLDCNLNLISFNADQTAFIVSVSRCSWTTDYFISVRFDSLR